MSTKKYYYYYISYSHKMGTGFSTFRFNTKIQGPESMEMLNYFRDARMLENQNITELIVLNWKYLGYFNQIIISKDGWDANSKAANDG